MAFPVLAHLIASAMATFDNVQFIWHGGETTLVPITFYKKAMALQARYLRPGCTVRNDLQTNGTRIDDEWAQFFRENKFGVGVSLDGPREIHDRQRLNASGQPSFDRVLGGLDTLKRHGIPLSILMVVDEDTLALGPNKVFDFFLEVGIKKYGCLAAKPHVNPGARPGTPAKHYVEPRRMTEFLCSLYDRWLEHGDPEIQIREIHSVIARFENTKRGFCTLEGDCLGHYFIAEPNGDLAHCDLFLGDPSYSFGNIMETSFSEILNGANLKRLRTENAAAISKLRSCREFSTCMGGCPHDRYISYRHNPDHTEKCCGQLELISYIRSRQAPKDVALASAVA